MIAIIPVAGEGVRLKPHTHFVPKCLLYVAGRPILGHILDGLRGIAPRSVVMVLGAHSEAIIRFCRTFPYRFRFVTQHRRLGLGHAVSLGARGATGPALVVLGDTIVECDYRTFCRGPASVLAVKEVEDPHRFGIVEAKGTRVIAMVEKPTHPRSNLAITGLYYFSHIERLAQAMQYIIRRGMRTRGEYQLTDGMNHLLKSGEPFTIARVDKWFDCGTPQALIETNRYLLKRTHAVRRRPGVVIRGNVFVADSATVENSIIGPDVSVGEAVTIRGSIVADSIINEGAAIENAILAQSIVGRNALVRGSYRKLSIGESSTIEFP